MPALKNDNNEKFWVRCQKIEVLNRIYYNSALNLNKLKDGKNRVKFIFSIFEM